MTKHYFNEKETTEWLSKLPKKSVAVKVIVRSDKGNILLVKPNYKPKWQFPGGGVEAEEGPEEAAVRELKEELGWQIEPADLRLVDTVFRREHDNLILMYNYTRSVAEDMEFTVQQEELDSYKFASPEEVKKQVSDYYDHFLNEFILKPYTGDIIEESLADPATLKTVNITSTRIEKVTPGHQTPWLKQWTLHTIEVQEGEAAALAERLSHAIETKNHSWYIDFKNDTTHYIIFSGKVFKVDRRNPEEYKPVVSYGAKLGIPRYQLDFSPEIAYWERPEEQR